MHLRNCETQFKNTNRKVYRKIRENNHRFLTYRNKYKLAKPVRVRQSFFSENHNVPFGKKLRKLRRGLYVMAKVITKFNYKVALDTDATRTQVVHQNHLVEYFPCENELPKLSTNYEKRSNDDTTENFYNEIEKNRLCELN